MLVILSCSRTVCCWKEMAVCLNKHVYLIKYPLSENLTYSLSGQYCSVQILYLLLSSAQFDVSLSVASVLLDVSLEWLPASLFSTHFPSALSQPCRPVATWHSLQPDTRKTTLLTSTLLSHCASQPCSSIWFIYNLAFCPALSHTEVRALTHFYY